MELICNCLDLDGSWDVTWMEVRRKYRDLDGSESGLDGGETHLETWI